MGVTDGDSVMVTVRDSDRSADGEPVKLDEATLEAEIDADDDGSSERESVCCKLDVDVLRSVGDRETLSLCVRVIVEEYSNGKDIAKPPGRQCPP